MSRESRFNFTPGTTPFTISGGEGVYLHTSDGRKILDGGGGAIVSNIGYGRPEIAAAAAEALTSLLIFMNKKYASDHTGIRITGINKD